MNRKELLEQIRSRARSVPLMPDVIQVKWHDGSEGHCRFDEQQQAWVPFMWHPPGAVELPETPGLVPLEPSYGETFAEN